MADPAPLSLLRQLFLLQRMGNALVDDSDRVLRALFDNVIAELAKLDPTAVQLRFQRGRVDRFVERATEIIGPAWDEWLRSEREEIARIGAHQVGEETMRLRAVLGAGNAGVVSDATGLGINHFKRILDSEPFEGAILKEWAAEQKRRTVFRVSQQVKLGVANGETLGDIVRRVRGRSTGRAGQFAGGVLQTTTREAESIVRTAVMDVVTHARMGTYEANADILTGYQLVVTMDGRTSPTCINYGLTPEKVYPLGSGPRPPFHFGCRTATAPVPDWKALGMEPPDEGTRATATGQAPGGIDFDDWLRSAPDKFAVDLLGPTRARLFKERRVTLRELLRTDRGRVRLTPVADLAPAA
jgi:hypothetical protein